MRAFRWYNLVYILVMSLLLKEVTSEDGSVLFEDIYGAVIDSYDANVPFEENMYIILNLFCPQLLATSCSVNEETMGRLPIISNTSSDVINIAREFAKKNAQYLNGCCGKCSCGDTCFMNGNCCYSNMSQHELDNSNLNQPKSRCVQASIKQKHYQNSYFMVSTCLNDTVDIDVEIRCLEPTVTIPDEVIPVVSYTTKIVYLNRFCALCNHENDTVRWEATIKFDNPNSVLGELEIPDAISDIFQLVMENRADIEFIPPAQFNLSYEDYGCVSETSMSYKHCNTSGTQINISGNEIMNRACSSIKIPFTTFFGKPYPNVFCYLCNKRRIYFRKHAPCESIAARSEASAISGLLRHTEREVDVAADNKNLANFGNERSNKCTCREIFDQKQSQCRHVYCPYMKRYARCSCIRYIENVAGLTVKAFLEIRPISKDDLPKKWEDVKSAVNKRFRKIGTFNIKHYAVFQGSDRSGEFFYFVSLVSPKSGFDVMETLYDVYTQLRNGLPLSIDGIAFELSLGEMFELKLDKSRQFNLSENENMFTSKRHFSMSDGSVNRVFYYTSTLSQLLFCRQILLTDDETEVFTNSTDFTRNGKTTKIGNVYYSEGKTGVKICLEDYVELFQEPKNDVLPFHNVGKVNLFLCVIVSTYVAHNMFETYQTVSEWH